MLSTVSDRLNPIADASGALVAYYQADITSATDYYPFGMQMPGRVSSAASYRYGFNGKENDNEVKGTGNQQDYGMRIYDPRLGKFLSVDPISDDYPWLTPYQFASNRPIDGIDRDGLEWEEYGRPQAKIRDNKSRMTSEQAQEYERNGRKAGMAYMYATFLLPFDLLTGGNGHRLFGAAFTIYSAHNVFEYTNRNGHQKDPNIQAENSKKANGAVADLAAGWVGGKVLGAIFSSTKGILITKASYGEVTVSTQVGKEMVEVGRGGIGAGGYMEMEINVKVGAGGAKVASGGTVFDEIYNVAKAEAPNVPINGVKGIWTYGDNLKTFNDLIINKVNKGLMTTEEAALQTFTGRTADGKGFSNVSKIFGEQNADGTYKSATVLFTK